MRSSSRIQARKLMLALALIYASISSVHVDAFRSSATAGPPDVVPLDLSTKRTSRLPQIQQDETNNDGASNKIKMEKPAKCQTRQFKYDLGIGKNKPVVNKRIGETSTTESTVDPTRYLMEHEAVSSYPSPLDSNTSQSSKSKRKNLPKVNHRRHSEDVLHIRDTHPIQNDADNHKGDNSSHPVIVPIYQFSSESGAMGTQLDVNTVWVEMMLHNERSKVLAQ
eukprot:CAMPEP_0116134074 /NCGR_PEP_ID=MMETSP0329-20121206/10455_1 /TAXON_ID=697910 /ORGANISM="Pseudo-nitzschia arenysensis, Strain B593" /LENGTH=222 /DNA_ID=CAMNT_0003628767 /DNA_START=97 /DNA_END=765 /DNA_ORIENTATION=-